MGVRPRAVGNCCWMKNDEVQCMHDVPHPETMTRRHPAWYRTRRLELAAGGTPVLNNQSGIERELDKPSFGCYGLAHHSIGQKPNINHGG